MKYFNGKKNMFFTSLSVSDGPIINSVSTAVVGYPKNNLY